MGELGRCGYLINKRYGALLRLSCVTTDLPLREDPPVNLGLQTFCARCLKCARTCPAQAIPAGEPVVVRGVEKWRIDPVRCLLYWDSQGAGCSICQVVCPWSSRPQPFRRLITELTRLVPQSTRVLVKLDDLQFGREYRRVAGPDWAGDDFLEEA
jgi:epoxyqueuosine reductase QueG